MLVQSLRIEATYESKETTKQLKGISYDFIFQISLFPIPADVFAYLETTLVYY